MRPDWAHLWHEARREERDWYYLDNAWFDDCREQYFRVGRNVTQGVTAQASDGKRFAATDLAVNDWRTGKDIIVCRQSDEYLRTVAGWQGGALAWQEYVLTELRSHTDRPIVVRVKGASRPLRADLQTAHLLVTHSSAAAIEALLAGVPVITTDPLCAAARFTRRFDQVEAMQYPDGRQEWFHRLADSQWTLDELKQGAACKQLQMQAR